MKKVFVTNKGWRIGYTLTAWNNKEEMLAFRNTGAHKEAMKRIKKYAYRYKTLRWESDQLVDWKEAAERLKNAEFVNI